MNLSSVTSAIKATFNQYRKPAAVIPAVLMVCSLFKRPGLSTLTTAANVISRQSEFGAPTGELPDGTQNMINCLIKIIVEEVFKAIREEANIQIAIPIGGITIQAQGANAGGHVVVVGSNITHVHGCAVLQ